MAVPDGVAGAPASGEDLTLVSPLDGRRVRAEVVGAWRPRPEVARAVGPTDSGLLVPEGAFDRLAGRASSVRWRALPAYDRLGPSQLAALHTAATRVDHEVEAAGEDAGTSIRVSNPLPDVLSARSRELTTQRLLLLAPALVLLLLGAAGALLVAGALAEVRGSDESLLRSRGAGFRQMVGPTVVEAAALCGLAALAAPVLATAVVRVGGVRPPLGPTAWLGAGVAALVCWVALVLPVVLATLGGDRGEQLSVERRRRRTLTALLAGVLLMVALGVVAVIRLRGFAGTVAEVSRRSGSVDPLMVAAPTLLLLSLVTVLALVLLPVLFALTERALRARGVALAVGTRSATRAPARTVPFALAVALAAGAITFATVEHASQEGARAARATYEVGADVRVTAPASSRRLGVDQERDALASLAGVREVSGVARDLDFVDDVAAEVLVADLEESVGSRLVASADDPGRLLDVLQAPPSEPGADAAAAVTRDLAEQAALRVGDLIQLTPGGATVRLQVAGVLEALPTISEGHAGVVVGREPLRGVLTSTAGAPGEWWLAVDEADVDTVASRRARSPRPGAAGAHTRRRGELAGPRPGHGRRRARRCHDVDRARRPAGRRGLPRDGPGPATARPQAPGGGAHGSGGRGPVGHGNPRDRVRRDDRRRPDDGGARGPGDGGGRAGRHRPGRRRQPLVPAPELEVPWMQTAILLGLLLLVPLAGPLGLGEPRRSTRRAGHRGAVATVRRRPLPRATVADRGVAALVAALCAFIVLGAAGASAWLRVTADDMAAGVFAEAPHQARQLQVYFSEVSDETVPQDAGQVLAASLAPSIRALLEQPRHVAVTTEAMAEALPRQPAYSPSFLSVAGFPEAEGLVEVVEGDFPRTRPEPGPPARGRSPRRTRAPARLGGRGGTGAPGGNRHGCPRGHLHRPGPPVPGRSRGPHPAEGVGPLPPQPRRPRPWTTSTTRAVRRSRPCPSSASCARPPWPPTTRPCSSRPGGPSPRCAGPSTPRACPMPTGPRRSSTTPGAWRSSRGRPWSRTPPVPP